ncbi:HAD family hydrolase [Psychrobacter sp. I-STPA10]|uniref:HAD family hydrolase n=1 Tax=Psychrobacter sp. I-STPA10 TaxID=2585769 RepID=UPI001E374A8E|nr:HAD-IA family hydrolase [Psychrobacter sp. I-STPA10]
MYAKDKKDKYTNNIQAILFDLDGTLIDTAPDFIRIINKMCTKYQHTSPSEIAIREQVSAGSFAMVKLMFGDRLADMANDNPQLLAYRQEFLDTYEADICVDSQLFAGFDDMLHLIEEQCKKPWGIVTNKPRYLAELLLEKLDLTHRCAVLICPDDVTNTKPDPEPLFLACQQLGVEPSQCIYVGDHVRDIEAGNRAGMITVLASYGYIPPEDKDDLSVWGADFIVNNPKQMQNFVANKL